MSDKKKYNCGQIVPSSCVPFTGKDLTFVTDEDQLTCDANINDVIEKIDAALKVLVDANNFSTLVKNCLDFDPATVTAVELHQLEINTLCLHKGQIESLQTQFNEWNIGTEVLGINLGCLTPAAADCAVAANQYQLIALLQLFAAKLCDHETRITNLES